MADRLRRYLGMFFRYLVVLLQRAKCLIVALSARCAPVVQKYAAHAATEVQRYSCRGFDLSKRLYETKVPSHVRERIAKTIDDWKDGKLPSFLQKPVDETEFYPAALEIVEQPPSPASRAIAGTIMWFFTIALLWACLGSVDIVATAQGKILPTGRTKIIQPLEAGVVRSIHVQDGQKVKAGEMLIEIDSTITESERDRLQKEYIQAELEAARLTAASDLANDPASAFAPPEGATGEQVATQRDLLSNQRQEIISKLEGLDQQIAQQKGNLASVAASINKLTESIPFLEKRAEARKYLADKGYGSKLEYLATQQDLVEHQQEVEVQKGKLAEATAAVASLEKQRTQAEAEYQHKTLGDLEEAKKKATSLHEQLIQAAQKFRLQTLTAPVDGTVQQLSVHTEGGVVTPAQVLMALVPADSHLEIEAMVSNKDIGFVREGQEAAIKVDTFSFTRYGLLHGKVLSVSQDAVIRERPQGGAQGKQQIGAENETSEPQGQELIYMARISMDETQMEIDDRLVSLSPGMAVTAEIKTGSRHVISYLLSPIKKHTSQALRER